MGADTNLLLQLTSFIGREREMAQVKRLLSTTRLLTLTGAGGSGKTRLALQVASDLLDDPSAGSGQVFPDGVWLVELAPLSDPALIAQAIASVFDIRETPGSPLLNNLTNYLRVKNLLLVLDNCEHLIDASAQLVETLLRSSQNLRILATSREEFGIAGETTFRVPSLSLPDLQHLPPIESLAQYESIRLFIDRATATKPDFQLTSPNAPTVVQICQRLDGMPLAIELAAARVKALSVEQIAARLNDRFQLLTGGSRTALPRQQTLRAAIDWSYDLLSEQERILFRRLSVFAGGWTLEAAEFVCAVGQESTGVEKKEIAPMLPSTAAPLPKEDMLDLLTQLVGKSLVLAEEHDGSTRYRMLETIRQYAREKLLDSSEVEQVRDRHLDFYLRFAEDAESKLVGAEQRTWLDRVEREYANLRLALECSLDKNRIEKGLRMAGALHEFWFTRGYWSEAYQRLLNILKAHGADKRTIARGKALYAAGRFANYLGYFEDSLPFFNESTLILREVGEEGRAFLGIALAWYAYALVATDITAARSYAEEAAQLSRESGNIYALAQSLNVLGLASRWTGDWDSARKFIEESAAKSQEIGDNSSYSRSLNNFGRTYLAQGDLENAKKYLAESQAIAREIGDKQNVCITMTYLGNVARIRGQYDEAESLLKQAILEVQELGDKRWTARALLFLGRLRLTKGNHAQAEKLLRESLSLLRDANVRNDISAALESFAFLSAALKQPQRAARLFGAAETLREKLGTPLAPIERKEYEPYLAAARAQLDEASFNAAWTEGRAMTIDQVVEEAGRLTSAEPASPAHAIPAETMHYPAGLTAREVEVLRLLARGLSNQQIADQLVLSKRTVHAHLRSIYSKLDVTTRSAATRAAIDQKIV